MKKLKSLQRLYCAGKSIDKGKTFEAEDSDARVLVAYKQAAYVNADDAKVAKGVSTKSVPPPPGK